MQKLLKPASVAFYLLMLITFLILGLFLGGMIESGKDHGLAGGAIVLGSGVLFGGVAFLASFFIAYYLPLKTLIKTNWILFVLFLVGCGYIYREAQKKFELQQENDRQFKPTPTTPTEPVGTVPISFKATFSEFKDAEILQEAEMGMGYFSPDFFDNPVLYFYGNPNPEKSAQEHTPSDSMTFARNEFNQFEIVTAPPWLVPEVMKLDYEMLYFRIVGLSRDFAQVIVNGHTHQTAYVSRSSGDTVFWPDFLLGVNSVEFFPESEERVRVRPFLISDPVSINFEFMRPIQITGDWMEVLLIDSGFRTIGKGWIQWNRDDKLLLMYNLLS